MSRLRSITAQSPAIVISIVALVFALGSGAGYAATHAATAAAKLTLRSIPLRDGWVSAQSTYNTGNPSYAIENGIVYLSGSVLQASAGSDVIGVLPKSARPKHYLYLSVYTLDGTAGTVQIRPNGQIYAYSTPSSDATGYTSLASISYPVGS